LTELALTFVVFGALGAGMAFMIRLLGPRKRDAAKDLPSECGGPSLQEDIPPGSVPLVSVAPVFLLFDIEAVFFFPWALALKPAGPRGVLAFLSFPAVPVPGFLCAWRNGAFDWK
jgi:NADH-quinone oxidoreductase subunit A